MSPPPQRQRQRRQLRAKTLPAPHPSVARPAEYPELQPPGRVPHATDARSAHQLSAMIAVIVAVVIAAALPFATAYGPWWGLGRVTPKGPKYVQTWDMAKSTGIMICNNSGQVNAEWAARWGMVDIDWNSDKRDWSKPHPMNAEENMLKNAQAIQAVDPSTITWVYRNGIKALPWSAAASSSLSALYPLAAVLTH